MRAGRRASPASWETRGQTGPLQVQLNIVFQIISVPRQSETHGLMVMYPVVCPPDSELRLPPTFIAELSSPSRTLFEKVIFLFDDGAFQDRPCIVVGACGPGCLASAFVSGWKGKACLASIPTSSSGGGQNARFAGARHSARVLTVKAEHKQAFTAGTQPYLVWRARLGTFFADPCSCSAESCPPAANGSKAKANHGLTAYGKVRRPACGKPRSSNRLLGSAPHWPQHSMLHRDSSDDLASLTVVRVLSTASEAVAKVCFHELVM